MPPEPPTPGPVTPVTAIPYAAATLIVSTLLASMLLAELLLLLADPFVSSLQPLSAVGATTVTASPSITEAAVRSTAPFALRRGVSQCGQLSSLAWAWQLQAGQAIMRRCIEDKIIAGSGEGQASFERGLWALLVGRRAPSREGRTC